MQVIMIVATNSHGVIGVDGKMPWHYPEDLKRFKKLTTGHAVIMGRKTFESIGSKPLPHRANLVLSRSYEALQVVGGCLGHYDLGMALQWFRGMGFKKCFIIGGSEIYKAAEQYADTLLLTEVPKVALQPQGRTNYFYWHPDLWDITSDAKSGDLRYLTFRKTPNKNFMQETQVNFEDLPRFNQGFGGFGPLEKCNTGRLMKSADVEEFQQTALKQQAYLEERIKDKDDEIIELHTKLIDSENSQRSLLSELKDTQGVRDDWRRSYYEEEARYMRFHWWEFCVGTLAGLALFAAVHELIKVAQ